MISGIFSIIQLILQLLGLWDLFLSELDKRRLAEAEVKRQAREKAVDDVVKGETDEEIFDAETRVVDNRP